MIYIESPMVAKKNKTGHFIGMGVKYTIHRMKFTDKNRYKILLFKMGCLL